MQTQPRLSRTDCRRNVEVHPVKAKNNGHCLLGFRNEAIREVHVVRCEKVYSHFVFGYSFLPQCIVPHGFPTCLAGVWPGSVHVSGSVPGASLIQPLANLGDAHRRSGFYQSGRCTDEVGQGNRGLNYMEGFQLACNEARPRERSDRGRFLPIGKKASSYRGAYRVPLFN